MDALIAELRGACGAEHVLPREAAGAYAVHGLSPLAVAHPGTMAELAAVMAVLQGAGVTVVPWGGGTAQALGLAPVAPFVIVATGRLRRVLRHEPADLTISVEAGLPLAELGALLRGHRLMLPLDAPLPQRATVGGLIATGADGPRRLGYGTLRDQLIGITVVEASGRISKAGGLVVKNVSGFDLMKLYLGSRGTLAIVASANFKLFPLPPCAATLRAGFAGAGPALEMARALGDLPLHPAAVEFVCNLDPGTGVHLSVWAEGNEAAVRRHEREARALAQAHEARECVVLEGTGHEAYWARVADLPRLCGLGSDEAVVRAAALPAALPGLLCEVLAGDDTLQISARVLCGVAYLRVRGQAALRTLAGLGPRHGASIEVLAGPRLDDDARPSPLHALAQKVRAEFDPLGQLNRGRFP